jgi:hypothetical protein
MHTEFVVQGRPISNQSPGPNLTAWRIRVVAAAAAAWGRPILATPVRVTLINFHARRTPSVDVDNMSKPIHDAMSGIVYADDRLVRQAEIVHLHIATPMMFAGVSRILVGAVQAGLDFVYVRVGDPIDPYPLPR